MGIREALGLGLCALALSTAACSTQYMGTAPAASPQKTFVVGSYNNVAAVWSCKEVEIED
jgi:hypothetical protein